MWATCNTTNCGGETVQRGLGCTFPCPVHPSNPSVPCVPAHPPHRYYRKTKLSGFQDMECILCGDQPPPYEPHCKPTSFCFFPLLAFSNSSSETSGSTSGGTSRPPLLFPVKARPFHMVGIKREREKERKEGSPGMCSEGEYRKAAQHKGLKSRGWLTAAFTAQCC